MANTALNRTTQVLGTNKSGGALNYGDVVVLDNTNDNGFTTTTTAGLSTRGLGVIIEPNGIANNASGMIAVGGWCPKINLNTSATDGQFIKTHTVAGQGTPHASPQVEGDFAVALTASATPAAILFGSPNGPGGGLGTVTTTGSPASGNLAAFSGATSITNGDLSGDVTTSGTLAATIAANAVTTSKINNAAVTLAKIANASSNSVLVGSGAAGSGSAYAEIALGTGLSMSGTTLSSTGGSAGLVLLEEHTASSSSTLDFTTAFSSAYDNYMISVVGIAPATNDVNFQMRVSTDAGSTWDSGSNYAWATFGYSNTGSAAAGNQSDTSIGLSNATLRNATAAWLSYSGMFYLYPSSSIAQRFNGSASYTHDDAFPAEGQAGISGVYLSTTIINGIRFFMSSGNIASGTIRVYGLAK